MPCVCPARCRSHCLPAAALGLWHTRVLGLQGSASHCLGVEKVFPCMALGTGTFSSSVGLGEKWARGRGCPGAVWLGAALPQRCGCPAVLERMH